MGSYHADNEDLRFGMPMVLLVSRVQAGYWVGQHVGEQRGQQQPCREIERRHYGIGGLKLSQIPGREGDRERVDVLLYLDMDTTRPICRDRADGPSP